MKAILLLALLTLSGCASYNLSTESKQALSKMTLEQATANLFEVSKVKEDGTGICSASNGKPNKVVSSDGHVLVSSATAEIKAVYKDFFEVYIVSQKNCSLKSVDKKNLFGTALSETHVCDSYYSDVVKVFYNDISYIDQLGIDSKQDCKKAEKTSEYRLLAKDTIDDFKWFFLSFELDEKQGEKLMTTFMYLAPEAGFRKMM